jgi:arylsulfatase A-like enzyme
MGLLEAKWGLSPRDEKAPPWADETMKEWNIRCMEVYAAMLDCMDQGIGRIVKALEETGRIDNALIFFMADNGGCAEPMGRSEAEKIVAGADAAPTLGPKDLQPDMIPKRTRDGKPVRQGAGVMPGPADTFIGYGLPWANVSNTPFREYKHWVHEGGISSPLVAHWPKGISADRRNAFCAEPAHLIDIMATCVDVAGATYPNELKGEMIQPMEGVSLRPALEGKPLARTAPIFWEHEGNRALRQGRWKIVSKHAKSWELYDIDSDRSELNDLAAGMPDRVREMVALYDAWAVRCGVRPWPVGDLTEDGGKRPKKNN